MQEASEHFFVLFCYILLYIYIYLHVGTYSGCNMKSETYSVVWKDCFSIVPEKEVEEPVEF